MFFRMTELWNYPKYGCPFKHGNMYYYFHNSGLQNQRLTMSNLFEIFLQILKDIYLFLAVFFIARHLSKENLKYF